MIQRFSAAAVKVILCAAFCVFAASTWSADTPTGDLTQNIDVYAANGILKYHGRNETQYRDLTPGRHPLTSGSFLKTGNGPAEILLPDNTVLSLDANTEVKLGMYTNGTLVVQHSGRVGHFVEHRAGKFYLVKTPYFTAKAVGTEFRTRINYPVDGAVTVERGEVEFVYTEWDPVTGQPQDVYDFVPQGSETMMHDEIHGEGRLRPGEHEVFHASTERPARVIGEKRPAPADDNWTLRGRNLGRAIMDLRNRLWRGGLTPEEHRQKLGALLGISPDLIRGRLGPRLGGLWIGQGDICTIRMCIQGDAISQVHIVDNWIGWDKEARQGFQHWVNFSFPRGYQMTIGQGGNIDSFLTDDERDSIWKGATLIVRGHIGERTGRILIQIYSETDVAAYYGSNQIIDIRLVDPNGCDY